MKRKSLTLPVGALIGLSILAALVSAYRSVMPGPDLLSVSHRAAAAAQQIRGEPYSHSYSSTISCRDILPREDGMVVIEQTDAGPAIGTYRYLCEIPFMGQATLNYNLTNDENDRIVLDVVDHPVSPFAALLHRILSSYQVPPAKAVQRLLVYNRQTNRFAELARLTGTTDAVEQPIGDLAWVTGGRGVQFMYGGDLYEVDVP